MSATEATTAEDFLPCEFFAGCTNEAEGTLFHPFRVHPGRPDGLIPTCRHCAGRVEEELKS